MSRENVDRFVEATDAFNRGDVDAWLEHFSPEIVFEPQVAAVEGAAEGHDGVRSFIATIGDLYESFEVRLHEVRDFGERIVALGTAIGVGKKSEVRQETPLAIVARFEDGRMTSFKDYGDEADAFEAVGPPE
jgi:ketosteroid isomerase-like protein